MGIFKFENNNFEKIERTQFSKEGIYERQDIQKALKKQFHIIDDILIISEEFSEWNKSHRSIDLLGIDKEGNIVVIELKRTETGEYMDLQAIRYAAMVSTLTFKKAVEIYDKYLKSMDSDKVAVDEMLSFLNWEEETDDFASDVKIILVSSNFSKELTTSVLWLNERDIDIRCFRLIPYKFNNDILIDVQQIIPLPEAESYQIKVKEQKEAKRESKKNQKDNTKYSFNGENNLGKRDIVRCVWKQYINDKPNISYEKLIKDFPKKLFVEYSKAKEKQKKDNNGLARYFMEEDEILNIGEKKYVISNQWSINNIYNDFIRYALNLGYKIEEIK